MNEYKPSILESENPDYVLIHKRTFTANCCALAIAVGKLAEALYVAPEYISGIISEKALQRAERTSPEEIEQFIKDAIEKRDIGTLMVYKETA